ncbi:hypothetical protein PENTCL1PPCAC_11846, partial [Pristionchus entomophagus]
FVISLSPPSLLFSPHGFAVGAKAEGAAVASPVGVGAEGVTDGSGVEGASTNAIGMRMMPSGFVSGRHTIRQLFFFASAAVHFMCRRATKCLLFVGRSCAC